MLRGRYLIRLAFFIPVLCLVLLAAAHPVSASSFATLNVFGFPVTPGSGSSGSTDGSSGTTVSGGTTSDLSNLFSGSGVISATAASVTPPSQYTASFGTGWDGLGMGVSFNYPEATHDASSVSYANNVAFEDTVQNDALAFPDINVNLGSSFPSIASGTSDFKFADSVQLQLTTESDTMPISGFVFPTSLNGFFL